MNIAMRCLVMFLVFLGLLAPVQAALKEGAPAPAFTIHVLGDESRPRGLEDYRGKVVLLNLWASWCTGCKAEMPELIHLQDEMKGRPFAIVAVSLDKREKKGVKFIHKMEKKLGRSFNFDLLYDPKRAVGKAYRPLGMPSTYLIDAKGVLRKIFIGNFNSSNIGQLKQAIEDAL